MWKVVVERSQRPPIPDVVVDLEDLGGFTKAVADVHDPDLMLVFDVDDFGAEVHVDWHAHAFSEGVISYIELGVTIGIKRELCRINISKNLVLTRIDKDGQKNKNIESRYLNNATGANVKRKKDLLASISHLCGQNVSLFVGKRFNFRNYLLCLTPDFIYVRFNYDLFTKAFILHWPEILVESIILSVRRVFRAIREQIGRLLLWSLSLLRNLHARKLFKEVCF